MDPRCNSWAKHVSRRGRRIPARQEDRPVETRLAELLDHLGIAHAHFAGRSSADLQGFASRHPERMASLTLLCPTVLDTCTLAPLAARLLVVTGDQAIGRSRGGINSRYCGGGRSAHDSRHCGGGIKDIHIQYCGGEATLSLEVIPASDGSATLPDIAVAARA